MLPVAFLVSLYSLLSLYNAEGFMPVWDMQALLAERTVVFLWRPISEGTCMIDAQTNKGMNTGMNTDRTQKQSQQVRTKRNKDTTVTMTE